MKASLDLGTDLWQISLLFTESFQISKCASIKLQSFKPLTCHRAGDKPATILSF